jgi:hypothetical protein
VNSFKKSSRCGAVAVLLLLIMLAWHDEAIAGQLTMTWVDNSSQAAGVSVERSTDTTGAFAEIAMTGPEVTTYLDSTVADATTYCYRVRAFDAIAYSDYSNTACGASAQAFGLAVVKMGAGSGTVISGPSGVMCGSSCSGTFATGTAVTLTSTPAAGSTFAGWSGGGCAGTATCTVTLTSTTTVTATFNESQGVSLTVSKSGAGSGTVSSSPSGIDCGTTCSASYPYASAVSLVAVAPAGSIFTGWNGACCGTGSCNVTLMSSTTVTATFSQQSQSPTLNVSVSGKGIVTSTPAGIDCGKTCSVSYASGAATTLAATTGSGFSFVGWGGACTGTGSCTVSMTADTTVTATFRNAGAGKR